MRKFKCNILVVGVGGAGGNAINNMFINKLSGVELLLVNTDAQVLWESSIPDDRKIMLGENTATKGLGAGSDPEKAKQAAEESLDQFIPYLENIDMVFFTAGMGGGTGTGSTEVLAQTAKEMGKLVIGVVTSPFDFEGGRRQKIAEEGINKLKHSIDTLIVIPNENLFKISGDRTTFVEAFKMADDVLYKTVQGITSLITDSGLINLDFADVKSVMSNRGFSIVGFGDNLKLNSNNIINHHLDKDDKNHDKLLSEDYSLTSSMNVRKKIEDVIMDAMTHPLLDEKFDIGTSEAALLHIVGGVNLTLFDVDAVSKRVHNEIKNPDVHILIGATILDNLDPDDFKILIVATGVEYKEEQDDEDILVNDKNINNPVVSNDHVSQNNNIKDSTISIKNSESKKKSFFQRLLGFSFKDNIIEDDSIVSNKTDDKHNNSNNGFESSIIDILDEDK